MKTKKINKYTDEAMTNALSSIRSGMTISKASRQFGVPRGTIHDRLSGRVKEGPRKMGRSSYLTPTEESRLVKWIIDCCSCGLPVTKQELTNKVAEIVTAEQRSTPFKENKPGKSWLKGFFKRNKNLSFRQPELLSKSRAIVTKEGIKKWFDELADYLTKNNSSDILNDPNRIFNGDESGFMMCPKTGKVLAPKGTMKIIIKIYIYYVQILQNFKYFSKV